jgi:hypothetical protein
MRPGGGRIFGAFMPATGGHASTAARFGSVGGAGLGCRAFASMRACSHDTAAWPRVIFRPRAREVVPRSAVRSRWAKRVCRIAGILVNRKVQRVMCLCVGRVPTSIWPLHLFEILDSVGRWYSESAAHADDSIDHYAPPEAEAPQSRIPAYHEEGPAKFVETAA